MKYKTPYIIAEVGSNHDNNELKLSKFFEVVKNTKANAIKFQIFRCDDFTLLNSKQKKNIKKLEIKEEIIRKILQLSKKHKIEVLFSIFGKKSFQIVKKYKLPQIKIASSELINHQLLSLAALNFNRIFISTGMSEISDIAKSIEILKKFKAKEINLLHCIADYPTKESDVNMEIMNFYKNFELDNLGFSDHTLNNVSSLVSLGFGTRIFEKHITLNKQDKGPDNFYALDPNEFKKYVEDIKLGFKSLGKKEKIITLSEKKYGRREGIYFKKNLKKGSKIVKKNIFFKMPAIGISKKYFLSILGMKVKRDKRKNEPIFFEDLL